MKTRIDFFKSAVAVAAGLLVSFQANGQGYAFDPLGINHLTGATVPGAATTFTQVFTNSSAQTLDILALGVYGFQIVGNDNITVSLFDWVNGATNGPVLATEIFNPGSPGTFSGDYTYKDVSLDLGSGTYAIVTSYAGGVGTSGYYHGSSGAITAYHGSYLTLGPLYQKTGASTSTRDDTAYGSGSIEFVVPEPGLFGFAVVGLLGLVLRRRLTRP